MSQRYRWTYMEHWRTPSPQGPAYQYHSAQELDRFVRQIAAVGFTGLDMFDFNLRHVEAMHGSLAGFERFLQSRGIEKLVGIFHAARYTVDAGPHRPESHDGYLQRAEALLQRCSDLSVENLIVMPLGAYPQVEPVTDEMIKVTADFWSRFGAMTLRYGVRLSAHHEFWGGIRSAEEIEKFYAWSDPETVFFFCDAGQHVIAGVDPVELYERYHDRTSGFHLKDTHDIDTFEAYRGRLDAELNAAVPRWFWEMGTPEGLVDFPALMDAIRRHGYGGWIGVEHDKANVGGGSYAEATAVAMNYAAHTLRGLTPPRIERPGIRFGYAINQYDREHDGFTRREQNVRAFQTIAAAGFTHVELLGGSGRWEPLGRRELIDINFGSARELLALMRDCGLEGVCSLFYEPSTPWQEEQGALRSVLRVDDHPGIIGTARHFSALLAELGGDRLVVHALPSAWQVPGDPDAAIATAARLWNEAGAAVAADGVRLTAHVDALSLLATPERIAAFLAATDPATVGLTLDTGELMLAQIDPLAVLAEHVDRVDHVHLKDVYLTDTLGERTRDHAETAFLTAGGERGVGRWFEELGFARGLVDVPAVLAALERAGYTGTIVAESDQSIDPPGSVMANGWYLQHLAAPER